MNIVDDFIEKLLVITLSGLSITAFFTWNDTGFFNFFSALSLFLLLVWRFIVRYEPTHRIPKSVFVFTLLFIASLIVSTLISENRHLALDLLKKYKHIIMAGMLVGAPFSVKSRKITIAVFFGAAACAGLAGLLQHFNVLHNKIYHGAHGYLSNPIFYAADLAFVSGSAIIMLFIHDNAIIKSWKELLFLVLIALLTFGGIIVSLSRGAWITFLAASMITLSIYDKKKAAVVFLSLLLIIISLFYLSPFFRQRAISTVTSLYTENEQNSTGNRIELWKGSLLIVQKSPLVGVGIGDFEQSIDELINAQKLKMMPAKMHAHNIFFQVLSTQGIIGFVVFIGLLAALISWGFGEIHSGNMNGGYIIILSTLLTMIGGLTESTIVISKFLAVYCLTIGLLGPYGARNRSSPAHLSAEIV